MGQKRRGWNKLISKWIKSDRPDAPSSSVILLKVARTPPSPKHLRRPLFSLPQALGVVSNCSKSQVRRNSSTSSSLNAGRRNSIKRHDSLRGQVSFKAVERSLISQNHQEFDKDTKTEKSNTDPNANRLHPTQRSDLIRNRDDLTRIRKTINDRRSAFLNSSDLGCVILPTNPRQNCGDFPLENRVHFLGPSMVKMETSVDSIGACSLDMEASRELPSDWSEVGSTGTLHGSSHLVSSQPYNHLPSYLSLACTVNGYSTTTNYDPERLARSRDASPHRLDQQNHLTSQQATYSVANNLLSPPNLVPLPTSKMSDEPLKTRSQQQQVFYRYSKTVTILTNQDESDGCHRGRSTQNCRELFSYNRTFDGTLDSTTVTKKDYSNGTETKSFIQQRVERLYGPGALAQGFFVSKRQKNRLSESEEPTKNHVKDKLNKTLPDKLSDEENIEPSSMKQSSSSPALPVLRHLRPEFRAQLPLASPKKVAEAQMQKSVTVPKLKDDTVKVNGEAENKTKAVSVEVEGAFPKQNGITEISVEVQKNEKDGHYFIKILEEQTKRLLSLADGADAEIDRPNLSEETIGKLRSASGKARLLVSQKMQQFRGLCTNNINQSIGEAFPTTNADLQGFWDMVMLQVDQVDKLFEEIARLRRNNWIEESTTQNQIEIKANGMTKPRKTNTRPKVSAATEEARKQREEQRKRLIEDRRKAMKAAQQEQASVKIFMPESS
ncbi:hypothetical protein ABEB36_003365 [Hypothenemus hampei]|uniref:Uncharacterized protein n=1 Tax=Hypothenemus hampei TaxID=57062 RepID=A0ABD1F8Y9_HYPHA